MSLRRWRQTNRGHVYDAVVDKDREDCRRYRPLECSEHDCRDYECASSEDTDDGDATLAGDVRELTGEIIAARHCERHTTYCQYLTREDAEQRDRSADPDDQRCRRQLQEVGNCV